MKLYTVFTVLSVICTVLRTAHGVTDEDTNTFLGMTPYLCSTQTLCSTKTYSPTFDKYYFSSGCGEYCSEKEGSIIMMNFSDKKLTSLSADISKFTSLIYLDLSRNSLTTLPDSIKNIWSLRYLY